jgi:hypothetical protein
MFGTHIVSAHTNVDAVGRDQDEIETGGQVHGPHIGDRSDLVIVMDRESSETIPACSTATVKRPA